MCCLRSTKQRGTLTEYLSTFLGFEPFPCPNGFAPAGRFYEGNRSVLDILQPKTTQIFSKREGCEVRGLFWHQFQSASATLRGCKAKGIRTSANAPVRTTRLKIQ